MRQGFGFTWASARRRPRPLAAPTLASATALARDRNPRRVTGCRSDTSGTARRHDAHPFSVPHEAVHVVQRRDAAARDDRATLVHHEHEGTHVDAEGLGNLVAPFAPD